jgi:FPC/CPF motif-containing protein YcgG
MALIDNPIDPCLSVQLSRVGTGCIPTMYPITFQNDHPLARSFIAAVEHPAFPCVGAKSALGRGQMDILVARDMASAWDDMRIMPALSTTVARYRADRALFRTMVVLFEGPHDLSEAAFEQHLWARAQSLSDKDEWLGYRADPSVSSDPDDPHFSLSFAGEAFFVVGLHPQASRPARRFETPALVFNLHDQFQVLREQQRYEKLRSAILTRDEQLAGSVNPMLARHGELSEARQYSGRIVGTDWKCPFHRGAAHD